MTERSDRQAVPVAVVPEPQASLMMLAGTGLLGFIARRRKQSSNAWSS